MKNPIRSSNLPSQPPKKRDRALFGLKISKMQSPRQLAGCLLQLTNLCDI